MKTTHSLLRVTATLVVLLVAPAGWAQCPGPCEGDLDGDGCVDLSDLAALLARYGACCDQAWVPDENTVALWYLNGNGTDFSGNGNDLIVKEDQVGWVNDAPHCRGVMMGEDGYPGDCYQSDGGALTAPGAGCTYPGSGDWTVEAWVYYPSMEAGYSIVYHYSEHWAEHDPFQLGISSSGTAFFQINGAVVVSADVSEYCKQWFHLAAVYRYQQDVALWVDCEPVAMEVTTDVPETLTDYDVFLGGNYCGTTLGLKIDEVRISNVARYVPSSIVAWGRDMCHQVRDTPDGEFIDIGGGDNHSLAIRPDGTVAAWGSEEICIDWGQVSDTPGGDGFVAVDGGMCHSLALKVDGSLEAWGNQSGDQYNYGQVTNTPTDNGYTAISAEGYTNFALWDPNDDGMGSIVGWGRNDVDGTNEACLVECIPEGDDFIAVESSYFHALALRSDGSVVAWGVREGPHDYGQVTDTPPGTHFMAIAGSMYFSLAIEDPDRDGMGSLVGWGGVEEHGQLPTPDGNDFIQISVGVGHCLARRADGSIVAWGYNSDGQGEVPSGICNRFVDIEAGGYHNLAMRPAQ